MGRKSWNICVCLAVLLLVLAFPAAGASASGDESVIEGIVTADYQILTDNDEVYEIGETEKGDELMEFVDQRVRVTGTVEEDDDGIKIVSVTAFEVLDE